jgi:hypothetical protein
MAAGKSREEAIDAGHAAGLRVVEDREIPPEARSLVDKASALFGARVVGIVEPGTYPPIYDRCFEMFFPEPKGPAIAPRREKSEDQETSQPRQALAGELAKAAPPRQAALDFEGRSRTA